MRHEKNHYLPGKLNISYFVFLPATGAGQLIIMSANLKRFITKYVKLSEFELEEITNKFKIKVVRKNDYLLKQGGTCKELVFVEKGCLRLYYLKDDIEVSVWFAFAQSSAIEIYSFISENPSKYFLQAIEDSEVLYLPKVELNKLYQYQPKCRK